MSETKEEQVVLVNTLDEAQGTMEKMAAHRKGCCTARSASSS